MSSTPKLPDFTILGAGLTGSLLAVCLAQKGHVVHVYEKRPDPRKIHAAQGRSINLALSHRGIQALKFANVYEKISSFGIPMKGRMIHLKDQPLSILPYSEDGRFIYSISRAALNNTLIEAAIETGVEIYFEHAAARIDFEQKVFHCTTPETSIPKPYKFLFGADGAYSQLRQSRMHVPGFNFSQHYIDYGYKELSIPAKNGKHALEPNALHIWPREEFMLIALPNLDGSFTCTLFLSFKGNNSFESISDKANLKQFFEHYFPDACALMPQLEEEYFLNPSSSMITIDCEPWFYKDTLLVGDAAHAIVPFYGQGMNAGFEDIRLLMNELLVDGIHNMLPAFIQKRKIDTTAIGQLALQNFVEMRDLVADSEFQLRKKIEHKLHQAFPDYTTLYSLVTFSDTPYADAAALGEKQNEMFKEIMSIKDVSKNWEKEATWMEIVKVFKKFFVTSTT